MQAADTDSVYILDLKLPPLSMISVFTLVRLRFIIQGVLKKSIDKKNSTR